MSTDHATAPKIDDVLDRAEQYRAELGPDLDVDRLRTELAETNAALDVAVSALIRDRPSPHPRALGHAMKLAYFRNPGAVLSTPDERWTWAAEAAIETLTGLTPAPTVAGGGESAADSSAATGAPTPGDIPLHDLGGQGAVDDLARAMWEREGLGRPSPWQVLRPHVRSFYVTRARAALTHLVQRGWRAPATDAATTITRSA